MLTTEHLIVFAQALQEFEARQAVKKLAEERAVAAFGEQAEAVALNFDLAQTVQR